MNFRYILLLLLGNFFSFYGMKKELRVLPASQDLFDLKIYPATSQQMINFEKAKRKSETHPDEAEQQLLSLAADRENPYVPAMRELVHLAAEKNDYNGMALWATRAIARYNPDPACAVTLAGLLRSDQDITLFKDLSKQEREDTLRGLLISAAIPKRFTLTQKPDIEYVYQDENAQALLDRITIKEVQQSHEHELQHLTKPDLERLQFDVINKKSLPTACFFIKELIGTYKEWRNDRNQFCINRDADRALQWATFVAAERSGAHHLMETGAYDLLSDLGNRTEDEGLKQQVETFLERIDHNGSDISVEEQKRSQEYLLQVAASKDFRALLALAKGNDPKLFYASQLIYVLPEASEKEYAQLVKSTLQLLKPIVAEPNRTDACRPGELCIERNNTAGELLVKMLESPQFELYKNTLLHNSRAFEIGSLIYEIGCNFFNKKNSKQVRDIGKGILQSARAQGDIYAQWKLLAINKQAQTVDNFIKACAVTRLAQIKVDRTLLSLISEVLNTIEKEPSEKLRAQLGAVCIVGQAERHGVSMLLHAGQPGLETLLDLAPLLQDPRACFEAARHLIAGSKSLEQEKLIKVLAANFKGIMKGDSHLKKELTYFLKPLEETEFFIAYAFKEFCAELGENAEKWQQESIFVNDVIDILRARANTNHELKIFLKDMLKAYAVHIKHPGIPDPEAVVKQIQFELALSGNIEALFALIPDFSRIEPNLPALFKAGDFWHAFWKATRKSSMLKEKAEINMRAILTHYGDFCKKNEKTISPVFNYKLMMVLADAEPLQAMLLLKDTEETGCKLNDATIDLLFEKTGAAAFIEEQVKNQIGWGYFAKAIIALYRKHARYSNGLSAQQKLQGLDELRTLIERAKQAARPFFDAELLNEGMIDYWIGTVYSDISVLRTLTNAENKSAEIKCLEYYDRAALNGCAEAAFAWAERMLETLQETNSQEIFEQAIDRLIQSMKKKKEARIYLQRMHDQGFAQAWGCGGNMTLALREKIQKVLHSEQQQSNLHDKKEIVAEKKSELPETKIQQAIKHLNDGHYEQAFNLFSEEARIGNPIASVYLGIIEQQKLMGQGDEQAALEFFKKGLLEWDGTNVDHMEALSRAYIPVFKASENDIKAARAVVNFVLRAYTHQQTPERVSHLFKNLELMERAAAKSSEQSDKNLLFSSGLAQQIAALCADYNDISLLFSLVSHYARRIITIGVPDAQNQQDYLKEMLLPFDNITNVLLMQIIESRQNTFFQTYSPENTQALFANLESAACKGITSIPLERVIGLLYLSKSINSNPSESDAKTDAKKGVFWLSKAADRGDKEAALALGFLKIYGAKWGRGLQNEPKKGIEILEVLSRKGFTRAGLLLAYWYYDKKDFKTAEKYIKSILEKDSCSASAALLGAKIYYEMPSLLTYPQLDRGLYLYNLGQTAIINDPSLTEHAQLFQILLAISKYPHVMTIEEISKILHALVFSEGKKNLIYEETVTLANTHSFIDQLRRWADKKLHQTTDPALESIYAFLGWWYTVHGQSKVEANEPYENDFKSAHECLQNAQKVNNESPLVEALLLKLTLDKPISLDDQLEIGKKHFEKICELTKKLSYSKEKLAPIHHVIRRFLELVKKMNRILKK